METTMKLSFLSSLILVAALVLAGLYLPGFSLSFPLQTQQPVYPESEIRIPASTAAVAAPVLHAGYACVKDAGSNRILYGKKAGDKAPMASTTKIMTAILALESGKQKETVTVSSRAASMPKVHLGMQKGQKFILQDLLYSLMLESHNDTAVAIAEHLGGSVEGFAKMMNEKAAKLGMKKTRFVTPNGLDAEGHQSTPEDMCTLAGYAIKNKAFCQLIQTRSRSITDAEGKHRYSLANHDAFLSYYDGALGIKTGFTGKAGYCFVGAAVRNGVTLTSCVLASGWPPNKSYKWIDTRELMDYGFDNYTVSPLPLQDLTRTRIPVTGGTADWVSCQQPEPVRTLLAKYENLRIVYHLPERLCAPVRKSSAIGTVAYYINEKLFRKDAIYPSGDIEEADFFFTLKNVGKLWANAVQSHVS